MRKIVAKHIKNTLVNVTVLLGIVHLYVSGILGKSCDLLLVGLLLLFSISFTFLICKWVLFFYFSYFDTHKLSYDKGLNGNIHFECRDEIDQKLVKIGALYSITFTGAKTENGFINSIETNDYFDQEKKHYIRATLQSSWGISTKRQLLTVVDQLIIDDKTLQYDALDLIHFESMLKKNGLEFNFATAKLHTTKAISIQRAVVLLRDALTCDMITLEDFDTLRHDLAGRFNLDVTFILDYLFGAYCFYLRHDSSFFVFGQNRVNERMAGVKVLMENFFFERPIV